MRSLWRRFVGFLLSIGEYPGETETQQGKRRIFVVATTIAAILTLPVVLEFNDLGYTRLTVTLSVVVAASPLGLALIYMKPLSFRWVVHGVFTVVTLQAFYMAALIGGLLKSSLDAATIMIIPLAALIIFGRRAALFWFGIFVLAVIWATVIPDFVDPTYSATASAAAAAQTLIGLGVIIMAITLYFVRQRDRFQQQSDDLLHNILPDEIATRLKADTSMIADNFPAASVLFADVVGFTPMSAGMSPPQLVGLLNSVFTKFDEFVEELGLEKIKTVGDEYMVASGVPISRHDHAEALAELALRIRDHVATNNFDGHQLSLRIGINSGPVVAGIIGTHKFSYDMWGNTVNTASRMESEGIAGQIQVSPATYELIRHAYDLEPRGTIMVKGKGAMDTHILTGSLT